MTIQLVISVLLMSAWVLLWAYEAISIEVGFVGLMSFCIGIFLALWESKDLHNKQNASLEGKNGR